MPYRPSRDITERDLAAIANAEDSNDEDYDDSQPSRSKTRSKRRRGGSAVPRKKHRRAGYRGSDVSDDDEALTDEEEWTQESEEEQVETNDKGRPVRRSAKKAVKYEESDDDDDDNNDEDVARVTDTDPEATPRKSTRRNVRAASEAHSPKSKIVTLKVRTPLPPNTRSLRDRNPSIQTKPAAAPAGVRRSRRRSEPGDEEDLFELSNSGRHVMRAGSREPEIVLRPSRGSKSIKKPLRRTIDEEGDPQFWSQEARIGEVTIPSSQPDDYGSEVDENPRTPQPPAEADEDVPQLSSDLPGAAEPMTAPPSEDPLQLSPERSRGREVARPEIEALSEVEPQEEEEEEDEDEGPVTSRGRSTRASQKRKADSPPIDEPPAGRRKLRSRASAARAPSAPRQKGIDETSDFDPDGEGDEAEDLSDSVGSEASHRKGAQKVDDYDSSNGGRRSTRLRKKAASRQPSASDEEELELAEELAELKKDGGKRRRRSQQEELIFETRGRRNAGRKNYDLLRNLPQIEEDDEPAAAPSPSIRPRKTGGGWQHRTLLSTYGPFGGAGGRSLLGGPGRPPDADSDSSDDEIMKQPKPVAGMVGMTPTTAGNPFNPFSAQPVGSEPAAGPTGTPANLGKIKDKQALADADPLGVDQNVDFDSVGGLQGHIDQLKEMVALPLLYPEIFMRFKITPPRGVLFHGPPGTGKTLLARALATSVSSQGRKVTFYMRKGADALSKWVGEAERQLRMLFEEARKNQPSIIFFDEIDGLAPVRSSKQEQIHASIVSTLLALMDGMDGRGQVIVIGATNRPDSIDPALRRPGRFDREFYFPLPDTEARRAIIDIHTRGWDPPLADSIKDELAALTKGYGGADLRALCTEAALNAVQRRYPQIYKSKEKLEIDPTTIQVTPKDFMISIKKITPSSERSASSGATALPPLVAPLLENHVAKIQALISEILPQKKKTTALEEAMYEDVADGRDFGRERMQQAFETSRVFRPRLLINGRPGMGQQYVAAALLNHFQTVHVQSFDLSVLLGDTASTAEATVIRLFSEVRMHKPSVIFIPNAQQWYRTVPDGALATFHSLLRSIKPNDPIMVLGFAETEDEHDDGLRQELFGHSLRSQYVLHPPRKEERATFFKPLKDYIRTKPTDFPDPTRRKKRQLEILRPAQPERPKTPPPPTKEELKAQKKRDRQTLNMLKIRLQPIMDQIRMRHKKFRTGVIEESVIRYLYDEADPGTVTSDVAQFPVAQASFRPYEVGKDSHGVPGLVDQGNGKFYYNLDTVTIEKRLSNGFYKRPKDFLADIKRLAKDAKAIDDEDRLLKANELLANVEVDIATIELNEPALIAECEKVYQREMQREREAQEKEARNPAQAGSEMPPPRTILSSSELAGTTTTEETGQIQLGMGLNNPKDNLGRSLPLTPTRAPSHASAMTNGFHEGGDAGGSTTYTNNGADNVVDVQMKDVDINNTAKSAENPPNHESAASASTLDRRGSAQRTWNMPTAYSQSLSRVKGVDSMSQRGFVTPLTDQSQVQEYTNEASTTQTNSTRKTNSQPSNPSENHVQEPGPNLFMYGDRHSAGGSDLPDTQPTQDNDPDLPATQSFNGVPTDSGPADADKAASDHASSDRTQLLIPNAREAPTASSSAGVTGTNPLSRLLNPPFSTNSSYESPHDNLIFPPEEVIDRIVVEITDKTSGLSVEQLEQVNSVLMDVLWRTRGEWDRRRVVESLIEGFNEVLSDMDNAGQKMASLSWTASDNGSSNVRRIEG